MPFRCVLPRAAPFLRPGLVCGPEARPAPFSRLLHSSRALRDDVADKNHYEALNVSHDASPTEIKKSFYTLSKTHHPDHNRSDPDAPRNFMRISEAYSVLGTPAKRTAYDRDVLRLHETQAARRHHRPAGSYHSTAQAGGRAASGLSRRRGSFRGPPPSFYRSGGWGVHGEKRHAAHESSAETAHAPDGTMSDADAGARTGTGTGNGTGTGAGAGAAPGMGPGQDPFAHRNKEAPHFDSQSHKRTHRFQDERRAARTAPRPSEQGSEHGSTSGEGHIAAGFFIVAGTLAVGVGVPALILSGVLGGGDARKRKGL